MNDTVIVTSLTSLFSILLGAILGYYFDYRKNSKNKNSDYCMTIYHAYKSVSMEIIESIMPLTSLSLKPRSLDAESLEIIRKNISDLYFKHYIYLPQIVLNEINCLHSCLLTGGRVLFCIKGMDKVEICSSEDVKKMFYDTALVSLGEKKITNCIDKYSVDKWSESLKINLQARRVIRVLAEIFEDKQVEDWNSILKKETLLQVYNG